MKLVPVIVARARDAAQVGTVLLRAFRKRGSHRETYRIVQDFDDDGNPVGEAKRALVGFSSPEVLHINTRYAMSSFRAVPPLGCAWSPETCAAWHRANPRLSRWLPVAITHDTRNPKP